MTDLRAAVKDAVVQSARLLGCTCNLDVVVTIHPGRSVETRVLHDSWCPLLSTDPPLGVVVNPEAW